MTYITSYLRKNRNRPLAAGKPEDRIESAASVNSLPSVPSNSVFQIDFETWYSRLAGWNPIPSRVESSKFYSLAGDDEIAQAA